MKKFRAFTFIELLISMAITLVIITAVYSSFQGGIFGYRNIREGIEVYQAARGIFDQLNRDLRNAFAYASGDVRFRGGKNELSFFALAGTFKDSRILPEYSFVSYKANGAILLRLCRKNQEALKDKSGILPQEMTQRLEQITFSYLYFDTADNSLKERELWDDANKFPVAVKIKLKLKGGPAQDFQRSIFLAAIN